MVVPDHVRRVAVEYALHPIEAPVAAVDVPVPTEHVLLVRQQPVALPTHGAVQELPDVERRDAVGVHLVAARDDDRHLVLDLTERLRQVVPHLRTGEFRTLPEQAADPVGHVAGEEGDPERAPFRFRRRGPEPAQPVVAEQHPFVVPRVEGVSVPGLRIEPGDVENAGRVAGPVGDLEVGPAGNAASRPARPAHRGGRRQRGRSDGGAQPPPCLRRVHCLARVVEEEGEVPGPPGAHPEAHRGRGGMADDRAGPEPGVRPGPVGPEHKRVGGMCHERARVRPARRQNVTMPADRALRGPPIVPKQVSTGALAVLCRARALSDDSDLALPSDFSGFRDLGGRGRDREVWDQHQRSLGEAMRRCGLACDSFTFKIGNQRTIGGSGRGST